jgi:hypothetical protein
MAIGVVLIGIGMVFVPESSERPSPEAADPPVAAQASHASEPQPTALELPADREPATDLELPEDPPSRPAAKKTRPPVRSRLVRATPY